MARQYQSGSGTYLNEDGNIQREFQVAGGPFLDLTSVGSVGAGFKSSLGVALADMKSVHGQNVDDVKAYDTLLL